MFETERLILRENRPSDEAFLLSMFNSYEVLNNITTTYPAPSHDRNIEAIKSLGRIPLFVIAESKETGAPIGFTNLAVLVPQSLDGELGIAIAKEWWGKGYGTELMNWLISFSFDSMGMRRLSLSVFSTNPGAVALYEHVGFKHEVRQREAIWKEGKWADILKMGLLAREYYADHPEPQGVPPYPSSISTNAGDDSPSISDWIVI